MGRTLVRGHAGALTLLLAALLTGCSGDPGIVSDRDDLDAAVAVWTDPWVAPTTARVAGPSLGSNGRVDRVVGRRITPYAAGVRAATRAELAVATAHGWSPTSSTCGDTVEVALRGPRDELAQLVVTPDGGGAEAALQVVTRHHLDSSWRVPDAVARTCLDGASPTFEAPPLASAPIGGGSEEAGSEWEEDRTATDLVDAVDADGVLDGLGLAVSVPRVRDGVNRRQAPAAEASVPVRSLTDLADRLTGWRPTWATCGGRGPVLATFVREVADAYAVLAVQVGPDGATARVTLPMTEGPGGEWLDGIDGIDPRTCDDPSGPRRATGVPAVLPTDLTPLAD